MILKSTKVIKLLISKQDNNNKFFFVESAKKRVAIILICCCVRLANLLLRPETLLLSTISYFS